MWAFTKDGFFSAVQKVEDKAGHMLTVRSPVHSDIETFAEKVRQATGKRSLESVEFFDLDKVVEYALLLGNATTGAKVGFFLEQHREPLMVEDRHLKALQGLRPRLSTHGVIQIGEDRFEVRGHSWFDQEWSTTVLGEDIQGWDWFSAHLEMTGY